MDIDRYKRQTILPEIGETGQQKIDRAKILVIGAGGLGSPALYYLAAAGIGHITIVDHDNVDESNLHRQILFTCADIGKNKATNAAERLRALNPDINITALPKKLSADNAEDLISAHDLAIDGSDNFNTKFLINDASVKHSKPFVYGSILGFDGQVAVFNHAGGPCYRCLYPAPPTENIPSCAEAGVIGALAGMIGSIQAMEAIKLITAHDSFAPLNQQLLTINAKTMQTSAYQLKKDPNCPICSGNINDIRIEPTMNEITVADAKNETGSLFIDVREHDEWEDGHIDGADHLPLSGLLGGMRPDLSKDQPIILYCKKGMRSQQALQILKSQGYTQLSSMAGGFEAWLQDAA